MAKYRALADCFFDGEYHAQGEIFTGRTLEGYDLATATYLEVVEADEPAPKKGRKAPEPDEL